MKCFVVYVNDIQVCTAGIGDFGVLNSVVTWVRRPANTRPAGLDDPQWSDEQLTLDVAGLARDGHGVDQNAKWVAQDLSTGDCVRIEIVDREECDPPESC